MIGHFRVAMLLEVLGYDFRNNGSKLFKFFLTNTLEMKEPEQRALPLTNLIKEAEEAEEVKEKIPILVVLDNPPYILIFLNMMCMKIPRGIGGEDLAKLLKKYGYEITRQTGSHIL